MRALWQHELSQPDSGRRRLIPVHDGLLFVRRGIEPRKGKLALPGGFINLGETWQEAGRAKCWKKPDS